MEWAMIRSALLKAFPQKRFYSSFAVSTARLFDGDQSHKTHIRRLVQMSS